MEEHLDDLFDDFCSPGADDELADADEQVAAMMSAHAAGHAAGRRTPRRFGRRSRRAGHRERGA